MALSKIGSNVLFAACVLVLITACAATPSANVDYDPQNNFSNYRSFAWLSENPMKVGKIAVKPSPMLQPSIMAAIQTRLESRGIEYVAGPEKADFLVSFTVGSREDITRESYTSASTTPAGRGGWATAFYGGNVGASYTQGVLAIDVFDAKDKMLVWHGAAAKKITEDDKENLQNIIDAAVASILREFPPQ